MLLYGYYDEMTEQQKSHISEPRLLTRNDSLEKYTNYQKLVAGGFINNSGFNILPAQGGSQNRKIRELNNKLLYQLIDAVTNSTDEDSLKITYKEEAFAIEKGLASKMVELLILCCDMNYAYTNTYRKNTDAYYDIPFNANINTLRFNVTAPMYNIIDYKVSLERFHKKLSVLFIDQKLPLYNAIREKCNKRYILNMEEENYKEVYAHKWKSWTCIRNIEVLEDMLYHMEQNKPDGNSKEAQIYADFFKNAGTEYSGYKVVTEKKKNSAKKGNYYVMTYDIDIEDKEHYEISFGYLTELGKVFDEIQASTSANALFERMLYMEEKTTEIPNDNSQYILSRFRLPPYKHDNKKIREKVLRDYPSDFAEEQLIAYFPNGRKTNREEAENILNNIPNTK